MDVFYLLYSLQCGYVDDSCYYISIQLHSVQRYCLKLDMWEKDPQVSQNNRPPLHTDGDSMNAFESNHKGGLDLCNSECIGTNLVSF